MDNALCHTCDENSDKSRWADGPWKSEPDYVQFEHKGLPCVLHRGGSGAWCGYVGIPKGHPLFGKDYTEAHEARDIRVHGGLTYAEACQGHVCHVPKPGESDEQWWFGFDCAHAFDLTPAIKGMYSDELIKLMEKAALRDTYKDQAYVEQETRDLADQLLAMS